MNKNSKLFAVLSYITWIGFVASFLLRDKNDTLVRRHLNQALVINLISTAGTFLGRYSGLFGICGTILDIAALVLFIMGIVRALRMSEEPLPYIGNIALFN
ncbi:hypothetical protein [Butyrivibrio sp. AE3004]|uniref:hypothetical protein n=1 Tax=Butyrivibrio sp. AE3004 TaxID=1506994 RepID=UPI000493EDFD|nr:hypothetical protein [Butyrivibrio sp. AE3004]